MEKITAFFMSIITFILGVFGITLGGESFEKFADITYGTHERQVVDIYVPESAYEREYNGCILYIHGGSWTGGDKKDMADRCEEYAGKGYITATMSYRLYAEGNGVTAIDMVEDVNECIKRIKAFSDEKGLNITKLATSGYSAGAHISMLYAYANTNPNRGSELDFIAPAIPLSFTANQVGPSSFHEGVWVNSIFSRDDMGLGLAQQLSGVKLFEEKDGTVTYVTDEATRNYAIDLVSPASHVTSEAIPSLFGYGGMDMIVPIGNKNAIISAAEKAEIDFDLVMYPKSNHGLGLDMRSAAEYTKLLGEYLKTYFGY